jgi:hypothetical protein
VAVVAVVVVVLMAQLRLIEMVELVALMAVAVVALVGQEVKFKVVQALFVSSGLVALAEPHHSLQQT